MKSHVLQRTKEVIGFLNHAKLVFMQTSFLGLSCISTNGATRTLHNEVAAWGGALGMYVLRYYYHKFSYVASGCLFGSIRLGLASYMKGGPISSY